MAAKILTPRLRLVQQLDRQIEPLYQSALRVVARYEALAILQNRRQLLISRCNDEPSRIAAAMLHNAWRFVHDND